MGVITISLPEEQEKMIRQLAKRTYGLKKGAIARVIIDSVRQKCISDTERLIRIHALELLEKGIFVGGKTWKKRDELYD